GAVAYLKQSSYGLGTTDIALNNYYNSGQTVYYLTGCGSAVGTTTTATSCAAYTSTNGKNASTTGNITGVYDMSGGVYEYVMGVYSSGTTITYGSYNSASNFSPTLSCTANTYVNCYNNTANTSSDYSARILGDATAETRAWYSDRAYFVYSSVPWFLRGGSASGGASAGAFRFSSHSGSANNDGGSRASAFVAPS
ncbi:MAG: hypothetical protein Q4G04_04315, partial [bacterium]|nr:hypothetical protein [bacterium]